MRPAFQLTSKQDWFTSSSSSSYLVIILYKQPPSWLNPKKKTVHKREEMREKERNQTKLNPLHVFPTDGRQVPPDAVL